MFFFPKIFICFRAVLELLVLVAFHEGLNQLKEKWNEGKRPRTLSKWALLFVSPRGDYVAVAVRNRITIFRKDDNYMDPCGVFTSKCLI